MNVRALPALVVLGCGAPSTPAPPPTLAPRALPALSVPSSAPRPALSELTPVLEELTGFALGAAEAAHPARCIALGGRPDFVGGSCSVLKDVGAGGYMGVQFDHRGACELRLYYRASARRHFLEIVDALLARFGLPPRVADGPCGDRRETGYPWRGRGWTLFAHDRCSDPPAEAPPSSLIARLDPPCEEGGGGTLADAGVAR